MVYIPDVNNEISQFSQAQALNRIANNTTPNTHLNMSASDDRMCTNEDYEDYFAFDTTDELADNVYDRLADLDYRIAKNKRAVTSILMLNIAFFFITFFILMLIVGHLYQ